MALRTQKANINYLAKIVSLGVPIKHPNADRLQGFIIDGSRIWTDMTRATGDVGVYFPLECKLNVDLLMRLNLYKHGDKNADKTVKGYFEDSGRVKALRLRGEPSEGLFLTLEEVIQGLGEENVDIDDVGTEFNIWNDQIICEKYVPQRSKGSSTPHQNQPRKKRQSRLVDEQFRFHEDTSQLKKNLHKICPDDMISITYKLHGTSFVVAKVLTKRKLTLWQKLRKSRFARFFGVKAQIKEEEYDTIYSSRGVIKNEYFDKLNRHYYGVDLWGDIKDVLHDKAIKGLTFYGEAVGYTSTGGSIQSNYDYGYMRPDGHGYTEGINFGIYIYRITLTNVDGQKIELSWAQIKEYCDKYGIKYVPELFYGRAVDWQGHLNPRGNDWSDKFLADLTAVYLEKDCTMCKDSIPAEGIVVRKDELFSFNAYKLKSFRFLEKETAQLDKGEVDLETEQHEVGSESDTHTN